MSTMIERLSLVVILVALALGMVIGAVFSDGGAVEDTMVVRAQDTVLTPAEEAELCGGTVFGGTEVAAELGLRQVGDATLVATR